MAFSELFQDWQDIEDVAPGSVIFSERDPADVLYFILEGEVELSLNGRSLVTEKNGAIIGEMAMVESAVRNATATALTAARLARIDREQLKALISGNVDFSLHMMAQLANRLRVVDQFLTRPR